jgi:hypothetical protein
MEHFLAERYVPKRHRSSLDRDAAVVRAAGAPDRIRLLQRLYVPGDEICFYLFESESAELVEHISRTVGLGLERVLPVIPITETEER